ncbi:polyphosphate kinase 2 family protein [Planosporangium mesophilum]|uniref:Polyphosphate--nucleotide phosphotransferase n=1 Tax=Planosporangium mesophilum TaxID=689768 RepID=A0A8J3X081_9ACTN|nr:polyphosphate kinase 2 family protein [Planosporangium mesophilum]NJC86134.1 polyphosphate kinase 2 family protein [Planosporangium mesophilum]GII23017.1 polyphosphate--nucleotide phosphotransferase [Planosporangium mesophilum]
MATIRELLRVPHGDTVDLASVDPRSTPGLPDIRRPKAKAREQLSRVGDELAGYQERLYAQAKAGGTGRRLLLVLQAMDCGGKDGTIRKVIGRLNPQGVHIVSFGPPTPAERRHHFLWRVRREVPRPGYVGVFNRSHYEDVLVARVRGAVPERIWSRRYDEINSFERELVDEQVTIIKVMLHISPDEQRRRLRARLEDPTKYWKYDPADLEERRHWADYQAAYGDALGRCSTDEAPWYVVPADRKWYRDWAVAHLLRETLAELDPHYPPPSVDLAREKARLAGT